MRIVRMEFDPEQVGTFLVLFEEVKDTICQFEGCTHLELCRDAQLLHVYYTYSKWERELDLDNYRQSAFFQQTWTKTKALFGGKPVAYSLMLE